MTLGRDLTGSWHMSYMKHKFLHLSIGLGLEGLQIFPQYTGNKSLSFMGLLMKGP